MVSCGGSTGDGASLPPPPNLSNSPNSPDSPDSPLESPARVYVKAAGTAPDADTGADIPEDPVPGLLELTYPKTDGPDKNPLKGWSSGYRNDRRESSVGFQYIRWGEFEPSDNVFDTAAVEATIQQAGSKGRHLILRVYCQWGGSLADFEADRAKGTIRCPKWLEEQVPVLIGDNGNLKSPTPAVSYDFNNPIYLAQANELIEAFAKAYDNDPRIYAIELGILGYWGEWHTNEFRFEGKKRSIDLSSKLSVLAAYRKHFTNKYLMARYPWDPLFDGVQRLGFHNDFFVANNNHSKKFEDTIALGANWRTGPIGGEAPPLWDGSTMTWRFPPDGLYPKVPGEIGKGEEMIRTAHYSTMSPSNYRRVVGQPDFENYMKLHRLMGYNFQIDRARFFERWNAGFPSTVVLDGSNIGVAPFYYDWDVEFALLGASGNEVHALAKAPVRLSQVMPNENFSFAAKLLPPAGLPSGSYRVAVRIVQPGATDSKTKPWGLDPENVVVQFANRFTSGTPPEDGFVKSQWGPQNELLGGWSILGDVVVQAPDGLSASYFNGTDLAGEPSLRRIDPTVNFDWGTGAPGPEIAADGFSARWTGYVEAPVSGEYTFYVLSNDGNRLSVNGLQLTDQWVDGIRESSATIALEAGRLYPVKLEFFEGVRTAQARLAWSYPGQAKEVIPTVRLHSRCDECDRPFQAARGLGAAKGDGAHVQARSVLKR